MICLRQSFDVLVTGGAGFIGSNLVDALVESGRRVLVLDNFSTGYKRNLTRALRSGKVSVKRVDVTSSARLGRFVKHAAALVHLAAESRATVSAKDPHRTNRVNVAGTLNMLRAASSAKVSRFVFGSSAGVYGEAANSLQTETDALKPIGMYGASKLSGEAYCTAFSTQFEVPATILRFFNVYGPRQGETEEAAVISNFVRRLKRGLPPQIFGDGRQTRDFVHVRDVVRTVVSALDDTKAGGEVFNVGTGIPTSVLELAQQIASIYGREDLKPVFLPARAGDIKNSCANVEKLRRVLGIHAEIGLKDGLRRLIQSVQ